MKNLLILTAAAAVVLPAAAQAAPANIVVVDRERVYGECTACRAAQTQLQTQATALQSRQAALAAPLKTEGQSLQTAVDALKGAQPGPALQARITAFQTRQQTGAQELQRMQQSLQSSQANVVRQIDAKLDPIYSQVMAQKGANLALDVNATLAHGTALDVTNDVLAALNAALPSVSVTPAPAAATQGR
ncbi:MAG: OmpH family outer membrane protein [Sphingomicrobium sp.]|nr:OmpH family outer membrane protein [Sphingomonadales bacterium]